MLMMALASSSRRHRDRDWWDEKIASLHEQLMLASGFVFLPKELDRLRHFEEIRDTKDMDVEEWWDLRAKLLLKSYGRIVNVSAIADKDYDGASFICRIIEKDIKRKGKLQKDTFAEIIDYIHDVQRSEEKKKLAKLPRHFKKKKKRFGKKFRKWDLLPNDVWFEIASYQSCELRDIYRLSVVCRHFHTLFHWKRKGIHTVEKVRLYKSILAQMYVDTKLIPYDEETEANEMSHLYDYANHLDLLDDFGMKAVESEMQYYSQKSQKKETQCDQLFRMISVYDEFMRHLYGRNELKEACESLLLPFQNKRWRGQVCLFRCMLVELERKACTQFKAVHCILQVIDKVLAKYDHKIPLISFHYQLLCDHSWVACMGKLLDHRVTTPRSVGILVKWVQENKSILTKEAVAWDSSVQTRLYEIEQQRFDNALEEISISFLDLTA